MKVPIGKVSSLTYRDAWRVLMVMPTLLGMGLLVCLAEAVLTDKFAHESASVVLVTNLIGSLIATCLTAPILIAIYRLIVLGEHTVEYRIDFQDLRYRKFLTYSVALVLIFHVGLLGDILFEARSGASVLWLLVIWIGLLVISIKLMLLFPAIAVDIPTADWASAMRATRDNFWRIAGICILVALPVLPFAALSMLIESAREAPDENTSLLALSGGILIGIVNFITQLMLAVAASHLFLLLGNKMRSGPSASASPPIGV